MECLSSSAMSPDCSSSGSESSLTASAPSTPGSSPDYLAQLLKDRKQMQAFSNVFIHLDRILEDGELFDFFYYFIIIICNARISAKLVNLVVGL